MSQPLSSPPFLELEWLQLNSTQLNSTQLNSIQFICYTICQCLISTSLCSEGIRLRCGSDSSAPIQGAARRPHNIPAVHSALWLSRLAPSRMEHETRWATDSILYDTTPCHTISCYSILHCYCTILTILHYLLYDTVLLICCCTIL
jgi:hypothetical protein